jgi:hypothetical protein
VVGWEELEPAGLIRISVIQVVILVDLNKLRSRSVKSQEGTETVACHPSVVIGNAPDPIIIVVKPNIKSTLVFIVVSII